MVDRDFCLHLVIGSPLPNQNVCPITSIVDYVREKASNLNLDFSASILNEIEGK